MSWWLAVLAFSVGAMLGIVVMAALAAAGWEDAFDAGYRKALSRLDGAE